MKSEELELNILMLTALEGGPFKDVAELLRNQLEPHLTNTRTDYLGQQHETDLNSLLSNYPHVHSKTLGEMLEHLKQLKIHIPPSISSLASYLGTGQFSLLRTAEYLAREDIKHSARSLLSTKHYGPAYKNHSINVVKHLAARKLRGPVCIRRSLPTEIHTRVELYRRLMGHLSSVYCVCFDQSGQYVFTGADDHLIKIWSARDGRLLKTLRGHEGEITDMSVNYENRLLASGGLDKVVRIWDLKTSKLLDCLCGHGAMVTSVKFAPYNRYGSNRYLISTSNDGSVIFWSYHVDNFNFKKLRKFQERCAPGGRIVCSSFSTGGSFLACGSSDNYIHVYGFHPEMGPYHLNELSHHRDHVDSIQFCNQGFRFVSGSQDGTAVIWSFKKGRWKPFELDMSTQLDQTIPQDKPKPKVLIVQWSRDDKYVLTSLDDFSIKVWDSQSGKLAHILKEHTHSVYLIESHPIDPRICISASHDGSLVIWDIERAIALKKFLNRVVPSEGHNNDCASIYDLKFSPDGNMIAATDSYGYVSFFGNGDKKPYQEVPEQMFFHTDYRALIRDMRHFVMDEQTHIAPHLMPRPTLVDMNGDPYSAELQRFVPHYKDGQPIVVPPLSQAQVNLIADVITNHSRLEDDEFLSEKRSSVDDLVQEPCSSRINIYNGRNASRLPRNCLQQQPVAENSRYNTRYTTRSSFRSARSNFMPTSRRAAARAAPRAVRYYVEDEEEEEQVYLRPRRQRRPRRFNPVPSDSSTEEEEQDEETERDEGPDEAEAEDTDTSTETEIQTDDNTVIATESDSETEIEDGAANNPSYYDLPRRTTRMQVARCSRGASNSSTRSLNLRPRPMPELELNGGTVRRCSARLRDRKRFRRS